MKQSCTLSKCGPMYWSHQQLLTMMSILFIDGDSMMIVASLPIVRTFDSRWLRGSLLFEMKSSWGFQYLTKRRPIEMIYFVVSSSLLSRRSKYFLFLVPKHVVSTRIFSITAEIQLWGFALEPILPSASVGLPYGCKPVMKVLFIMIEAGVENKLSLLKAGKWIWLRLVVSWEGERCLSTAESVEDKTFAT